MSEFTEKLMKRAKELDSRPGLSSSYAPSRLPESSTAQSGSFAERLMSRARELDRQPKRQLTPSAPQLRTSAGIGSTGGKEFSMLRPGASISTEGATGQVRRPTYKK